MSKCIFLTENGRISLKFVPKIRINNIPALVEIMADQATSHWQNQWWLVHGHMYTSLSLNHLKHHVVWFKSKWPHTVYPKKYAHGFCFAVLCCGYTLTDFPISIRLTSLALWRSNDCPSASKATLMNMDKYFMWIHYERLYNHNKAKDNKTVCIFPGI